LYIYSPLLRIFAIISQGCVIASPLTDGEMRSKERQVPGPDHIVAEFGPRRKLELPLSTGS
jgi:hypothetical protein